MAISGNTQNALVASVLQSGWFKSLVETEADIKSNGVLPVISAVQLGLYEVVTKLCSIKDVVDDCGYSGSQLWSIR